MKIAKRDAESLLPLPASVFHILLALNDRELHGYGIMKEVAARTDGKVRLGPGTLYGSIKRLTEEGLIEESDSRPDLDLDDERRRYYRLTDFGQRVAVSKTKRLVRLVSMARAKKLLTGLSLAEGDR